MGDKVTRQLLKTTDGKPSTGKNVKLRPAESFGVGSDINLPETPALSGIYRSVGDVPHGVYKEVIEDTETGETISVEPGRACYAIYTDKTKTALVDRLLTDVVRLSGFAADTASAPTSDNLSDALEHAMDYSKTLVMTDDATLSSSISRGDKALYIDLNGKRLTLNGKITCDKAVIRNGSLLLLEGERSIESSNGICLENVAIIQGADAQFTAAASDRYINVTGLPSAIPGTILTHPIVVGCSGVSTADKLFLNSTKLGYLQNFVDSLYANLLAIHNWLTSARRTELDKFLAAPVVNRNAFSIGDLAGARCTVEEDLFVESIIDAPTVGTDGIGKLIPSVRLANSAYTASVSVDVSYEPENKRFINLVGNTTLSGSPFSGSPDVLFLMNSTGGAITLYSLYQNFSVPANRCVILAWNYATSRWLQC
jgi:hypothetical protein